MSEPTTRSKGKQTLFQVHIPYSMNHCDRTLHKILCHYFFISLDSYYNYSIWAFCIHFSVVTKVLYRFYITVRALPPGKLAGLFYLNGAVGLESYTHPRCC
jgi:hypothetical protein